MKNSETAAKGHPKGLYLLFFTEMWERFSYFGMRAILILYLTKSYLEGGLAMDPQKANLIYGFSAGFIYFTPLIGGWLADNYLGLRKSITIGGITMMIGQFILFAFNTHTGMYFGIFLLIIGNGFFKANMSTLVGKLYTPGDTRRDSAFSIFYMGVNLGAFLAPIAIGFISDGIFANKNEAGEIVTYGYKYGFLAAGIGMFLGQVLFNSLSDKYLGDTGKKPNIEAKPIIDSSSEKNTKINTKLTFVEKQRIAVIFIFFFFAIFAWAGLEQAGSSLTLYTERYIDKSLYIPFFGKWDVPTPIFQSISPLFIICLAPLFALFWNTRLGQRLSTPLKMGLGLIILGVGFFSMLGAVAQRGGDIQDTTVKAGMWWLVLTYLLHTIGELCISPVGLSTVSKLSPPKLASLLMGVWMLSSFVANILAGFLASTVETMGAGTIFFSISVFVIACGIILISLNKVLVRMMHGIK